VVGWWGEPDELDEGDLGGATFSEGSGANHQATEG